MNRFSSLLLVSFFLLFSSFHCEEFEGDVASSSTTTEGTTTAACIDNPDTDCASFKDYCTNDKYIPLLKAFCPVTCNFCPGATTAPPTTLNPNCQDMSTNCVNWVKNGFCTNSFYKCEDRLKYCAKSCKLCTASPCKGKSAEISEEFLQFVADNREFL